MIKIALVIASLTYLINHNDIILYAYTLFVEMDMVHQGLLHMMAYNSPIGEIAYQLFKLF